MNKDNTGHAVLAEVLIMFAVGGIIGNILGFQGIVIGLILVGVIGEIIVRRTI